jgi:hypothetical protein
MMFDCRFCGQIPFGHLLGLSGAKNPKSEEDLAASTAPGPLMPSKRDVSRFERRNPEELQKIVASWEPYVHPRAREFFPSHDMLVQVLTQIAKGLNHTEDPVLGRECECYHWYGETTKDEPKQACIRMVKPGESSESTTFVNRVLVFIFATDESFEQLMKQPKEPFRMTCRDQLCVNLSHISVD